jgi:hypothetical protein
MEDVLAILLIFGGGTTVLLAFSPVGKALAERIRGGARGPDPEVLAELDQLRGELMEVQERLDFAERMLARPGPE